MAGDTIHSVMMCRWESRFGGGIICSILNMLCFRSLWEIQMECPGGWKSVSGTQERYLGLRHRFEDLKPIDGH